MASLKINLFFKELLLFGAAQAIGVWSARRYLDQLGSVSLPAQANLPTISFKLSLGEIVWLTVILLLFVYFTTRRNRASVIFFRAFLWLIIFSGAQLVFSLWLSAVWAFSAALALVVLMAAVKTVGISNLGVILGIAGLGAFLGLSIAPLMAVFILAILSVYDIVAVYFTKHMVKMAEGMISARAIFGLIIPSRFSGFKEKLGGVSPGEQFMILGSGDVALPLVLSASLVRTSLAQAWVVVAFSLAGLFLTHWIFVNQKQRRPMAALPPIAMMSIIGYLVALILPL